MKNRKVPDRSFGRSGVNLIDSLPATTIAEPAKL
jgi:hypothetical protein